MASIHTGAVNLPVMLGAPSAPILGFAFTVLLIFLFLMICLTQRYKRCPSNKVLVVFGRVAGDKSSRCLHGGGAFVIPPIQDYAYLSLEPITVEVRGLSAASKENEPVSLSARYTLAISTSPDLVYNAAERLLGLDTQSIKTLASDITLGQIRQALARIPIADIKRDRAGTIEQIKAGVTEGLNQLGIEIVNINLDEIVWDSDRPDAPVLPNGGASESDSGTGSAL